MISLICHGLKKRNMERIEKAALWINEIRLTLLVQGLRQDSKKILWRSFFSFGPMIFLYKNHLMYSRAIIWVTVAQLVE